MTEVSVGDQTKYLKMDGTISDIHTVETTTDRSGMVILNRLSKTVKVHSSRLLPFDFQSAVVMPSVNKSVALCPKCGATTQILDENTTKIICDQHGEFDLHWLDIKTNTVTKSKQNVVKEETMTKQKPEKQTSQPVLIDLNILRQVGELWSKSDVPFDHHNIKVLSYVLLINHNSIYRKICINSYNDTYGKKHKGYTKEQLLDENIGFAVKDIDKEREKLVKNGYIKS